MRILTITIAQSFNQMHSVRSNWTELTFLYLHKRDVDAVVSSKPQSQKNYRFCIIAPGMRMWLTEEAKLRDFFLALFFQRDTL